MRNFSAAARTSGLSRHRPGKPPVALLPPMLLFTMLPSLAWKRAFGYLWNIHSGAAVIEFGDHDLDSVLRGEVHHAVVIAPVVFARRHFDRRPHEPVAEGVHADARGGLVIARPILFGRIRFAEVDGAVGEDRGSIFGACRGLQETWLASKTARMLFMIVLRSTASFRIGSGGRWPCRSRACQTMDCCELHALPGAPMQVSVGLLAAGRKNVGVLVKLNISARNCSIVCSVNDRCS